MWSPGHKKNYYCARMVIMFPVSFLPLLGMETEKDSEARNGGEKNNKGILPFFCVTVRSHS